MQNQRDSKFKRRYSRSEKLVSTNPAKNYEVLGSVEISSHDEIKKKVQKAHLAQREWKGLGVVGRVKLLKELVHEFSKRKDDLAKLITREMGMPISQSKADIDDGSRYFKWYLDNASKYLSPGVVFEDEHSVHQVFHEPIGTTAVITPWNFPFSNFVWGSGQNLIAGNTVVFKHSEECPLFGKKLGEIINSVDLPEGVFSEVYGDGKVGDYLVHQDIDLISFTGSTAVGQHLYKVAAKKFIRVVLEMGGSAPGIILEDGDVDAALEPIYFSRFSNCGQMCDALKRLIVHEKRLEEVVEKLKKFLRSKKVGDPEDETTDIGPLVAKRQLELLEAQVQDARDKGAKLVIGGKRPKFLKGAFYEPTLITNVTQDMRIWKEEVFGPVLPIVSFKTVSEAITLANDTSYGLGAYVFTKNQEVALEIASELKSGMVSINGVSYLQPCSPFGGYKMSGLGREHGKYGFHDVTQIKVVSIPK